MAGVLEQEHVSRHSKPGVLDETYSGIDLADTQLGYLGLPAFVALAMCHGDQGRLPDIRLACKSEYALRVC